MNDRQTALDEFATREPAQAQVMMPAVITHAAPPALVHGSQLVKQKRVIKEVLANINALAQAAGPDWYYSIPFKDKKTNRTTYVEGPSIKLANDLWRIYGNCDVDAWVSSEGLDYWEFTARFIDLESGSAMTRGFRQRKDASKVGTKDEGRNLDIAYQIGQSKAERNVICNALQTFADYGFEQARNSLVEKIGKDIDHWREETSERIGRMVDIKRVEAVIGRPVRDWLARDIAQVVGMGKAIKDGMATIDESFPPLQHVDHESTKEQLDEASGGDTSAPTGDAGDNATPDEGAAAGVETDSRMSDDDATSSAAAPDEAKAKPDPALHKEATDKLLKLASNEELVKEARMDALEGAAAIWEDRLDPTYFEALYKSCISVIKGHITEKDARKTLATIKLPQ